MVLPWRVLGSHVARGPAVGEVFASATSCFSWAPSRRHSRLLFFFKTQKTKKNKKKTYIYNYHKSTPQKNKKQNKPQKALQRTCAFSSRGAFEAADRLLVKVRRAVVHHEGNAFQCRGERGGGEMPREEAVRGGSFQEVFLF